MSRPRRRRAARALFAASGALAASAFTALGWAYCRTASCDDDVVGARCVPATSTDCGVPLAWPSACVGYSLQRGASAQIELERLRPIAARAFAAWSAVDCGSAGPSIEAVAIDDVDCDRAEYVQDGPNANVVVFRDDAWPYTGSAALALTTVTYVLDSGVIRDADLEVNAADATLTTGEANVDVDLESILTHEAGHVLGVAHSAELGATMTTDYPPGSTTLRSLERDDAEAICAAYPPTRVRTCDPVPRGGLGVACDGSTGSGGADDEGDEGCAVARVHAGSDVGGLARGLAGATIALVALTARARRRTR